MKKSTVGNESTVDNSILNKNMRVDMSGLDNKEWNRDEGKEGISDITEDQFESICFYWL